MPKLSSDQWREISPLLDEALALPDDQREAWLQSLTASKPQLIGLLRGLLEEHRAPSLENFLEYSPAPDGGSYLRGQTVGPYTLISPIGQGGMGRVWLAERSDGRFERRVAIKFLQFSVATRAGAERFKREGRILGSLTHPHIAELIDAGVMPDGQPFMVLEYVEGEPIDQYCDARSLSVNARIRLFLDVLAALSHAHSNLIVHRDIKPSNVLVSAQGEVKLLDFGIAKLLDDKNQPSAATLLTQEAGSALTPEYAAPEQLTGEAITTATDVYALGLLLYVLLTGQHPARASTHSTADLIKAIVEGAPRRMSDAVTHAFGKPEALLAEAANRGTTPEKLRRLLRGDLDTIVAKALKKNARERYASVSAMAGDLHRLLRHEPISARPDNIGYVTAKFLRRYWATVTALTFVIASLSVGLYVANRERAIAEQRFGELQVLSSRVFALDKSIRDLPGSTEARQNLVSSALQYLDGLAADSRRNLNLTQETAEGYWRVARIQGVPTELNLGEPRKAETSLKRADRLIAEVLASKPRNQSALFLSANIDQDRMILAQTAYRDTEALTYANDCAERLQAILTSGKTPDAVRGAAARMFSNIALAYLNMDRYADALRYARRTVELSRAIPSNQYRVAQGLSLVATALRYRGDLDAALQAIREARKAAENATYPNETFQVLNEYGILLREGLLLGENGGVNLGKPAEAIEPLQKAFEMTQQMARRDPHDATSRDRTATSGNALGNILRRQNPRRALAVYDSALRDVREAHQSRTTMRLEALLLADSSYALCSLHRTLEAKRRIAAAFVMLKLAKDILTSRIQIDSEAYVVLRSQADFEAATGELQQSVESCEGLLDKVMASKPRPYDDLRDAPKISRLYERLALLYHRTGDSEKEAAIDARRLDLWQHWDQKLPNNAFVRRQLNAASHPTGGS